MESLSGSVLKVLTNEIVSMGLRKLAFLNVFITDKLFRMSCPYFLGLDFVAVDCYCFSLCGLLIPWISWGELVIWGALPYFLPQLVGRRFLLATIGTVLRKQSRCQAPQRSLPRRDGPTPNVNIGFLHPLLVGQPPLACGSL